MVHYMYRQKNYLLEIEGSHVNRLDINVQQDYIHSSMKTGALLIYKTIGSTFLLPQF